KMEVMDLVAVHEVLAFCEGAVEANDVAARVLDSNAPEEAARAIHPSLGTDIEDPGPGRTQELAPHIGKVIMLAVKVDRVHEHHVHEAGLRILYVEVFGQTAQVLLRP